MLAPRVVAAIRILYHMARADLLERTRRYGFLLALALVLWMGYLSASGQFRLRVPPDYLGVINSAWVGATMTITVTLLLGWVGFYLVKGSVSRDYETGVGQIMATTPLSRPLYTLGKWFSNFAVLALMVLILSAMGIVMNLISGEMGLDLGALIAPLVWIALPCMALVAALAVLFEAIPWLRGGLGNIVYFFLFLVALIGSTEGLTSTTAGGGNSSPLSDIAGWKLLGGSITRAAKDAYPESAGGFAFSITELSDPKLFVWEGITWSAEIILPRLLLLLVAVGMALLAALFFDRFNPAGRLTIPAARRRAAAEETMPMPQLEAAPAATPHLTPLPGSAPRFRFAALWMAEWKLLLKGQPWWWYAAALGFLAAQFFSDLETTRMLLILAWVWPVLTLGRLGCRETRYATQQIVFSAPHPLRSQLPAVWFSAFAALALLGSGALLRFILAGETTSILGWLTGAVFIPSLALSSGILTGSSKTFEVLYVLWMYLLSQKAAPFDFLAQTPASRWYLYLPLAVLLLILAVVARQKQTQG